MRFPYFLLRAVTLIAPQLAAEGLAAASYGSLQSSHVRPLALSPSKRLLAAVNTTDNRVELFETKNGTLARRGETVVGLEPVAVAFRGDAELFVVNHLSDSVSVVDVTSEDRPFVRVTLLVGDEPRDVAVAGAKRNRLFVTAAARGQNRPGSAAATSPGQGRADVWVFDLDDLGKPPAIVTLFCDSARALAVTPDGRRVYAAAFLSGNRTTTIGALAADPARTPLLGDGFNPPPLPGPDRNASGDPAPRTGLIVKFDGERWRDGAGQDWSARVRFSLPDTDLFAIDADAERPGVIAQTSGVGTVLFNLAVSPKDGRVYVSNIESRNHVRFQPELRGHVIENRVTIVRGGEVSPVHLNPHVDYSSPEGIPSEIDLSLATPMGMEFTADGSTLYVCALSSGKVGVLDAEGAVLSRIQVGDLPTGLALHEEARRLYVMDRLFHAIIVVDLESKTPQEFASLRYSPEPHRVREGVNYLYDARQASGHGDAACASCHVFGDRDGLAWDLGDPNGLVEGSPLARAPAEGNAPLAPYHPMKGPMVTQSLRGLEGSGPLHWRGDRNGGAGDVGDTSASILAFLPTFQDLLGLHAEFNGVAMRKLRDFILSIRYPPNPYAPLDGSLTEKQAAGRELFLSDGSRTGRGGDGRGCTECHAGTLGTEGSGLFRGTQTLKVPHLRNLYQKVGLFGSPLPRKTRGGSGELEPVPTAFLGDQTGGFGFSHDGSVPTIADFLLHPLEFFSFPDEPDRSGAQKVSELAEYLLAFPSGLAPAVGQQVTLGEDANEAAHARWALLRARARAGDGDLVLHGLVDGETRAWLYSAGADGEATYQSDRSIDRSPQEEFQAWLRAGRAILTATLVPPGAGRRSAIDRDEDGALDGDERAGGFDPADPLNHPPDTRNRILRGDCNADGVVNISDPIRALIVFFFAGPPAPCDEVCDGNFDGRVDIADAIFLFRYLFRSGPTPGRFPECEAIEGDCSSGCPFDQ